MEYARLFGCPLFGVGDRGAPRKRTLMKESSRLDELETGGQCAKIDRVHFVSWVRCVAFTQ